MGFQHSAGNTQNNTCEQVSIFVNFIYPQSFIQIPKLTGIENLTSPLFVTCKINQEADLWLSERKDNEDGN